MSISNSLPLSCGNNNKDIAVISIAFVLCQDFVFQYFSGFVDVLDQLKTKYSDTGLKECRWSVIGERHKSIRSSCNIEVLPRSDFNKPEKYDCVVIIGGLTPSSRVAGDDSSNFIAMAHQHNVPLIGIASGRHVLASQNLLDGRKCAVDASCELKFRSIYPKIETVSYQPFVVDNLLITCSGAGSVMKLATTLMTQYFARYSSRERCGREIADDSLDRSAAASISQAIEYMKSNLSIPMPVTELAGQLGMTASQLDSAFSAQMGMTPSSVWRKLRLDRAYWLLTSTHRKITDIALECGYYDSAHFNKAFKTSFSATPKEVRRERFPQ
jgi:transcriptional regulator GlxA family with amidase domain